MAHVRVEGESKVSEEAVNGAKYVRQFFENASNKTFMVERIIAQGSWGFTLQIMMRSNERPNMFSMSALGTALGLQPLPSLYAPQPRPLAVSSNTTRFVLKRSLERVGENSIRREVDALDRLRGSMHIAQPSHIVDDPRWNTMMQSLEGPSLVMEWIENGLLWSFYERRAEVDEPLPNRLLWTLFLCLCRMVVALAWPPRDRGVTVRGGPELEVIPPLDPRGERPPKSRLLHCDFHGQNIMIDQLEPKEHQSVPMLKLIDFGMSRDQPQNIRNEPKELVSKTNIRAIGEVMLGLLRGNARGGPGMMDITYNEEMKRLMSYATDLDRLSRKYGAPADLVAKHQDRINNLDPEIRNLVALCVASKVEERPDIEDLLEIVERNAKNKREEDYINYKYANNESDAAIRQIIDDHIFNA
ncbi:hypothetical protein F4678DRAFT_486067 [Xylaria arbuscula]|nr:hypothetical protein F4678DRAFT_486067 [Xylaria arbuscula]